MSAADPPLRVLLVDDDEEDYLITRDLLLDAEGGARFRVEWVSDYEAALETMARGEHDVYLLDYRLGPRDGLALMREARQRGCSPPIILLTGQGDRSVDVRAMEAGATDYLVKGELNARLLERSIRYAIERGRLEQLRQSLLALASRELRGPIGAIKEQAIRLLLEDRGELAERAVDVTGHIIQAADHCTRLLDGFVGLSALDAVGAIGEERGRFGVGALIDEAVEAVRLAGRRCSCEVFVEEGLTEVHGDRYELLLVLAHLLANAAEHSPPGVLIRVSATRADGMVRFAVADQGPGISEETLRDLFTPFYLMPDPARRGARGRAWACATGSRSSRPTAGRCGWSRSSARGPSSASRSRPRANAVDGGRFKTPPPTGDPAIRRGAGSPNGSTAYWSHLWRTMGDGSLAQPRWVWGRGGCPAGQRRGERAGTPDRRGVRWQRTAFASCCWRTTPTMPFSYA